MDDLEEEYDPDAEPVEGFPDWRYVDKGDGNSYYYNVLTMESSWYPPDHNQKTRQDSASPVSVTVNGAEVTA
ncbi:hypothetical protein HDU76_011496 [Blyttiomyces sp. JEL0837]|nr:hypothetical protein HDU76_011496 [Blyttiomyces sp. JEL0837]